MTETELQVIQFKYGYVPIYRDSVMYFYYFLGFVASACVVLGMLHIRLSNQTLTCLSEIGIGDKDLCFKSIKVSKYLGFILLIFGLCFFIALMFEIYKVTA